MSAGADPSKSRREHCRTRQIRQQLTAARGPLQALQVPQPGRAPAQASSVTELLQPAAERGIIQGKVKMVADDRTNGLIVITRPEHFRFIEQIISALDRQVEPDVTIKVFSLEYANAKEVVDLLTSLVGAAGDATRTPAARTPAAQHYNPVDPYLKGCWPPQARAWCAHRGRRLLF